MELMPLLADIFNGDILGKSKEVKAEGVKMTQ